MDNGSNSKNIIIFVLVCIVILAGWSFFVPKPTEQVVSNVSTSSNSNIVNKSIDSNIIVQNAIVNPDVALKESSRIQINTETLSGSINAQGSIIDNLMLKKYNETVDNDSPNITLLNPTNTTNAYFVEVGYSADSSVKLPNRSTNWQKVSSGVLSTDNPLILSYNNGEGLTISRKITVDDKYMFYITDTISNTGKDLTITPWALVSMRNRPATSDFFILHEGPIAISDGTLEDISYKDLAKSGSENFNSVSWIGFVGKYFMVSIAPLSKYEKSTSGRFSSFKDNLGSERFQTDYTQTPVMISSGSSIEVVNRVFAGPKEYPLLKHYQNNEGITRFDMAIDFGWFWFITKPMLLLLLLLNKVFPMAVVLILITIIVKLALLPLAYRSAISMHGMRKIAPMMTSLKNQYKGDPQRYNKELMSLYKKEKVNPLSGCLPIIIQIPIFFSLYKILFVSIEMWHAPFYLWIKDMSAADPSNIFTLFGLIPWDAPSFLHVGILPILMGISMYVQQKVAPQAVNMDKTQAKVMQFMPVIFSFMLLQFPAGLLIYWTWSNILSIIQQLFINKILDNKDKKNKEYKK